MQKFNGNYYKMRMIREKFIVKEDKGIVICRQEYVIDGDVDWIEKHNIHYELADGEVIVTGVARCSKDDRFDERTGRMIAQTKANVKAYGKYEKWARSVFVEAKKLMETCAHTVLAAEDFGRHEKKKLDELAGGSDK